MIPVLTGLGLAAAAGWNAWAVLLLVEGLMTLMPQEFPGPATAFLANTIVLQVALVLFLVEFVVNKIPFLDRFCEAAHTLLRPIVGVLIALACVAVPSWLGRAAVVIGATLSTLAAHVAKSTTRLTSTAATRSLTQFLLSLAEDVIALVLATLVFFQPLFTLIFLTGLAVVLLMHRPRVAHALQVLFFRIQHPRRRTN